MATGSIETAPLEPVPWRALFVLGAASFASSAALRFCDPLLPKLALAFNTTPGGAAIVVTTYAVAYGGFQLITGPLGDRFGKVRVIALGALLCGLFTTASAFAASLEQLALLRFLAGLTGAAIIPNCLAFIGDTIPMPQRHAVLARYMIFMSTGTVSGQAIGGVLADIFGWHAVFLMVGGFLLFGGAVLTLQMQTNPVLSARSPPPEGGLMGSFRQIAAVRNSVTGRLVLATVAIEAAVYFGAFTFLGAHLREAYGISYTAIGALTALSAVGAVTYSTLAPYLLSRISQSGLMLVSATLFAAGFIAFAATPALWLVALAIVVCGAGFALFHNSLQIMATQINPQARGASIAIFAFAFFAGQTIGVFITSLAYDRFGASPLFATTAVLLPLIVLWFRARVVTRFDL
ncbi:MAG: MFS transporter [Phreatobacter sp.]|uniref:MFS transporter n=1 Tax=Phreatobacter sp. TaxID=1966341 RepID=UPI001A5731CB|nr:MFS transporter [Phreatobacter sp.]MBL8569772.1 MFS transporter [Phreatobacter sp.]